MQHTVNPEKRSDQSRVDQIESMVAWNEYLQNAQMDRQLSDAFDDGQTKTNDDITRCILYETANQTGGSTFKYLLFTNQN